VSVSRVTEGPPERQRYIISTFDGHADYPAAAKCRSEMHRNVYKRCVGSTSSSDVHPFDFASSDGHTAKTSPPSVTLPLPSTPRSATGTVNTSIGYASEKDTFLSEECRKKSGLPRFWDTSALYDSYVDIDQEIRVDKKFGNSGTTAVTLAADGDLHGNYHLTCAWVGDSRLLVIRDGKEDFATEDHKPSLRREAERVEEQREDSFIGVFQLTANGPKSPLQLFSGNGSGCTAMTRSIGDKDKARCLIAAPDTEELTVKAGEHVRVVIASDGVWDVMNNDAVRLIANENVDAFKCAQVLAWQARRRREAKRMRMDDISVTVVDFNAPIIDEQIAAACGPGCTIS
jgi:serine/threonine protein phosphatase PrpC